MTQSLLFNLRRACVFFGTNVQKVWLSHVCTGVGMPTSRASWSLQTVHQSITNRSAHKSLHDTLASALEFWCHLYHHTGTVCTLPAHILQINRFSPIILGHLKTQKECVSEKLDYKIKVKKTIDICNSNKCLFYFIFKGK